MKAGGCLVNSPEASNSDAVSALYDETVPTAL